MKQRLLFFTAGFLFILLSAFSIKNAYISVESDPISYKNDSTYTKEWNKIDSLESLSLPKSALKLIDQIYLSSRKEDNISQIIKSLIYKVKIINYVEEDGLIKAITKIEKEIEISKTPVKQILLSINAELYLKYFRKYQWQIFQRSVLRNDTSKDIKTWDANKLSRTIINKYQASLYQSDSLKRISISYISTIIESEQSNYPNLWPSIYDFVTYRASQAFSTDLLSLTKVTDSFNLDKSEYLSETDSFLSLNFASEDSLSLNYLLINQLQDIVRYRSRIEKPDALIEVELFRLKTIHQKSNNTEKDTLYLNAVQELLKRFKSIPFSDNIRYTIAEFAKNKAQGYIRSVKDSVVFRAYNNLIVNNLNEIIINNSDSILVLKSNNLLNIIKKPLLGLINESVVIPNSEFPIKIETQNIDKAEFKVFKIDEGVYDDIINKNLYGNDFYFRLIQNSELKSQKEIDLSVLNDYQVHGTEIIQNALEKGKYILVIEGFSKDYDSLTVSYSYLRVSELSFLQSTNNDTVEVFVLNRKTGKPVKNVDVQFWYSQYSYDKRRQVKQDAGKLKTNDKGFVQIKLDPNKTILVDVYSKDDKISTNRSLRTNVKASKWIRHKTHFFTDRSIYRPGQTVYFKAISLVEEAEVKRLEKNKEIEIVFYNSNSQKISSLNLTTNNFGSIKGEFVIPTGILNGKMRIQSPNGTIYFSVEEYKRPTLEVKIEPFKDTYRFNDSIRVKAKAKSLIGGDIGHAKYKYRVVRHSEYSFHFNRIEQTIDISSGQGYTNKAGEIDFNFLAKAENIQSKKNYSYSYDIEIDVVDNTGETHMVKGSVRVGTNALKLNIDIPKIVIKSKIDSFKIWSQNLNGEDVNSNISIVLTKIEPLETLKYKRLWAKPDYQIISEKEWYERLPNYEYSIVNKEAKEIKLIAEYKINTSETKYWKANIGLKEAHYKLSLSTIDIYGNNIKEEHFFTVLDKNSSNLDNKDLLFKILTPSVEVGENAEVLLGSSYKNVRVLLEIDKRNKSVEKRWISLNKSKQKISIPINKGDQGSVFVKISMVYNNRIYQKSLTIHVPHTDKKLDLKFTTFRDLLVPGEKEEWSINVKGKDGEKLVAEMLVSMYDASLDQFAAHNWKFNIINSYYSRRSFQAEGFGLKKAVSLYNAYKYIYIPNIENPRLNWFGFNAYGHYSPNFKYNRSAIKSAAKPGISPEAIPVTEQSTTVLSNTVEDNESTGTKSTEISNIKEKKKHNEIQKIRTNFNETAFFYPKLKTNKDGDVIFSFTMPESLTKWNFKAFAHTQDLKYGFLNEEIITKKELMVQANAPRFFRMTDEISFPIKLSNISEKTLSINPNVKFYDALGNKEITEEIILETKTTILQVNSGESKVIFYKLKIPEDYQLIKYVVTASSGSFSDGESKVIPVLSNRKLVTESMPLSIRKKGIKTYKFDKLIKNKSQTLKNYSYTLEMSLNPAWYAVQALPFLMENTSDNSEQIFSRFYANAMASYILKSNPSIVNVFDSWQREGNSGALLSNLEKNKDLKMSIIEESPWVFDAKNESDQKRSIAKLFDANNLFFTQKSSLAKLKELQVSSGAWTWYKGMRENRYITQLIVSGIGHLQKISAIDINKDYQLKAMISSAIRYLDKEITNDYKNLQKNYSKTELDKNLFTNNNQIQYLYMRSFFTDIINADKSDAYKYFLKNSQQNWNKQSKYMQAMIALTSIRNSGFVIGDKVENKIKASLKENALHSQEMGMYWKENIGYYWYEAPIERQALMIELFSEFDEEKESVDDLKVWLLKQKQTQNWKSSRATVEAVYALLMHEGDLASNEERVKVKLGNMPIEILKDDKIEAGTGYYKKRWLGETINPEMGNIELEKDSDGVAWGAVYWQYFEDLDKITSHKTPLHIEKELFIESNGSSGSVLTSIKQENVKVGDKVIVRIVLRVDRTMEYVHLKDMRASGFEPINVISGYKWSKGLGYYESTKDASTNFFFDYLHKGTYVFEYPLRAVHAGDFSNGISIVQCMYAPEFSSQSDGIRLKIIE